MKVDMVADLGVDKVADIEVDLVVGKVVNRVAIWWPTWISQLFSGHFSLNFFVFPSDFVNFSVKCIEFFSEMFCIFW